MHPGRAFKSLVRKAEHRCPSHPSLTKISLVAFARSLYLPPVLRRVSSTRVVALRHPARRNKAFWNNAPPKG